MRHTGTWPPRALALLALSWFGLALVSCGEVRPASPVGPVRPDPIAEAEQSREWAIPIVERRIRAIVAHNDKEFHLTDASYKAEQRRIAVEKDARTRDELERAFISKNHAYWEDLQERRLDHTRELAGEDYFAFKSVQWKVEDKTETMEGTADKEGPNKQRVIVACRFESASNAPKVGMAGRAVKSARVAYIVTPQGIDSETYGHIRLVEDSIEYWE